MANAPAENEQVPPAASQQNEEDVVLPMEPKMPTRKDTSLKEFLTKMDDYAPIVRDSQLLSSRCKITNRLIDS